MHAASPTLQLKTESFVIYHLTFVILLFEDLATSEQNDQMINVK